MAGMWKTGRRTVQAGGMARAQLLPSFDPRRRKRKIIHARETLIFLSSSCCEDDAHGGQRGRSESRGRHD